MEDAPIEPRQYDPIEVNNWYMDNNYPRLKKSARIAAIVYMGESESPYGPPDKQQLKNLWETLEYDVRELRNPTRGVFMKWVRRLVAEINVNPMEHDSFSFAFIGHGIGSKECKYMVLKQELNTPYVFFVTELLVMFTAFNCPGLAGCPKTFMFQCHIDEEKEHPVYLPACGNTSSLWSDMLGFHGSAPHESYYAEDTGTGICLYSDMHCYFAPEHESNYAEDTGRSIFVDKICKVFLEDYQNQDFESMIFTVAARMNPGGKWSTVSTLTKRLLFQGVGGNISRVIRAAFPPLHYDIANYVSATSVTQLSSMPDFLDEATKMKPLPTTIKALIEEAKSIVVTEQDTPRMELIKAALASSEIKRSFSSGSILIVGSAGVGKSSTINHLFGLKDIGLANTNDKESETRSTTEYKLKVDHPKYEVNNLVLGLVDSPGFNDTDGILQDACNSYSIKRFYTDHPELGGCYPNLIFILVKATDNRISGPNSDFAKSLKGLKNLNLVDEKNPNVVGILTWSCSLSPGKGKNWEKKIEAKKKLLHYIILRFLNVPAPIVEIENDFKEYELEMVDEYSKLPNGNMQPKNIYEAGSKLLLNSKDYLGLIILNACFANVPLGKSKEELVGFQVPAKVARKSELDPGEKEWVDDFEKAARGGIEDPLVYQADEFMKRENLSEPDRSDIQEIVTKVKTKLQVEDTEELQYIGVGNIISGQPLSDISRKFLEKLQIRKTPVAIESSRVIGQGYNARNDKIVPAQIFDIESVDSGYGVFIPSISKLEEVIQSRRFGEEYKDTEEMVDGRLRQLGIEIPVDKKLFNFEIRGGVTVKKSSDTEFSSSSLLVEERLFELKMANFDEDNRVKYTKSFKSAVEKLPRTFNVNDAANRRHYERFFKKWGQFIVVSAYCGGSVTLNFKSKLNSASDESLTFGEIKTKLLSVFNVGFSFNQSKEMKTTSILKNCDVNWNGGNRNFFNESTLEDPDAMRRWKISLRERPTMLQNDMTLEPISTVVGCIDKNKENSVYDAFKNYLGGEFKRVTSREAEEAKAEAKALQTRNNATTRALTTVDPPSWYRPWSMIVASVEALAEWFKKSLKRKRE